MQINIEKRHLVILIGILVIVGIGFAVAAWTQSAHTVWHDANDVKVSIGGVDKSLQEVINDRDLDDANCEWKTKTGFLSYSEWYGSGVTGACYYNDGITSSPKYRAGYLESQNSASDVSNLQLRCDDDTNNAQSSSQVLWYYVCK